MLQDPSSNDSTNEEEFPLSATTGLPPVPHLGGDNDNGRDNGIDGFDDDESDGDAEEKSSADNILPMDHLRRGTATALAGLSWLSAAVATKAAEINQNPQVNRITANIERTAKDARETEGYKEARKKLAEGTAMAGAGFLTVGDTIGRTTQTGMDMAAPVLETIGTKSRETYKTVSGKAGPAVAAAKEAAAKGYGEAKLGEKVAWAVEEVRSKVGGGGGRGGGGQEPPRPADSTIF